MSKRLELLGNLFIAGLWATMGVITLINGFKLDTAATKIMAMLSCVVAFMVAFMRVIEASKVDLNSKEENKK